MQEATTLEAAPHTQQEPLARLGIAFVVGLAIATAGLVLGSVDTPGDRSTAVGLLFGLAVGLSIRAEFRSSTVAFRSAWPIVMAVFTAAAPWVPGIAAIVAGVAAGSGLRPLVLFAGVPKTPRLPLAAFLLVGVAAALPLYAFVLAPLDPVDAPPLRAALAAAGIALAWGVLTLLQPARAAVLRQPLKEPFLRGIGTMLGAAAAGIGISYCAVRVVIEHAVEPVDAAFLASVLAAPCTTGAAAAILVAFSKPTLRRGGISLGSATLLAVGALGATLRLVEAPTGAARFGLAFFGAPCVFLGAALPVVVRLFGVPPPGSMIVKHVDPANRIVPDGAPWRIAALLFGAAVGPSFLAIPLTVAQGSMVACAGGVMLMLFDPRAGIGRKLLQLAVAGAAAAAGIAALPPNL